MPVPLFSPEPAVAYNCAVRPLIISHAACAGHAPENTLAGVRKALAFGADGIEVDVQCTADGVPVLMHDLTVDRTTKGTGAVAHLRLEELRSLDAGGEPPPTLGEALSLIKGKALLIAEIKQPGIEERVAAVVREAGALEDVMVWSFFPQALEAMRQAEPRLPAALLIGPQTTPQWPAMWPLAVRLGLQGVSVFCYSLTVEMARDARRHGLSLYTWTADPEEEIRRLLEVGVDGICTNYPDRAAAVAAGAP